MRVFATDDNNDLYIAVTGNLAIANDLEAVKQACEHAVQAQLGEMMFSVDQGVPTFETVWVGSPNLPQFEAALRLTLLAVPNVVEVPELVATRLRDTVLYTARIITKFGETYLNG